jgi:hypothetical protein
LPTYVRHWLLTVDAHSLHSPFLYEFYRQVVKPVRYRHGMAHLEAIRHELRSSRECIWVDDYGTGQPGMRRVSDIARTSLSTARRSGLYCRLVEWLGAGTAIELGTSLGLNALYLSEVCARLHTFEGSAVLCEIASGLFSRLGRDNLQLERGDIGVTLPHRLPGIGPVDFALIDANHRDTALITYFNMLLPGLSPTAALAVDDIRWNAGMYRAWLAISRHPRVSYSVDFGQFGLLFAGRKGAPMHLFMRA